MNPYIFVIGILVGAVVVWRPARRRVVEVYGFAVEQLVKRKQNKEKILELLGIGKELSNAEIREQLGISSRSVVRYMNQLEKEGKVEQHNLCHII